MDELLRGGCQHTAGEEGQMRLARGGPASLPRVCASVQAYVVVVLLCVIRFWLDSGLHWAHTGNTGSRGQGCLSVISPRAA